METRSQRFAREQYMSVIEGVHAALITPRREDSSVDLTAALELVDFACQSGMKGIAVLGTTGEFCHFSAEDRLHLIQFAVKRSRVPVIANVSYPTLEGAITLAREALSLGADALLLMPPYFFAYGQEEIREFYLRFVAAVGDQAPVLLYNIPAFTSGLDSETVLDLLSTGRFAGIKDSSGDLALFLGLNSLRERVPFTFLAGNDSVFCDFRSRGADGVVSGTACAIPELMAALDCAIISGEVGRVATLRARLDEFLSWTDQFSASVGVREATALRGFNIGPHAVPLGREGERRLGAFREWFQDWFPVVQKEVSSA